MEIPFTLFHFLRYSQFAFAFILPLKLLWYNALDPIGKKMSDWNLR